MVALYGNAFIFSHLCLYNIHILKQMSRVWCCATFCFQTKTGCRVDQNPPSSHGWCGNGALSIWRHEVDQQRGEMYLSRETWDKWPQAFCERLPCPPEWTNELMTGCLSYMDESFRKHLEVNVFTELFFSTVKLEKKKKNTFVLLIQACAKQCSKQNLLSSTKWVKRLQLSQLSLGNTFAQRGKMQTIQRAWGIQQRRRWNAPSNTATHLCQNTLTVLWWLVKSWQRKLNLQLDRLYFHSKDMSKAQDTVLLNYPNRPSRDWGGVCCS